MTQIDLLPPKEGLTKQGFVEFYSSIFNTQGYLGTLVFQSMHLKMLLFHSLDWGEDITQTSLGQLIDAAESAALLNAKQAKQCRTLQELTHFYANKSLLNLSWETAKGVYFFGKINDILFELMERSRGL